MRTLRPLLLAALLLGVPRAVRADIEHRNLMPLGEREAFLANTGIAGDGTGSVFYNPAGLGDLLDPSLSITATTLSIYREDADAYGRIEGTDLGYHASSFLPIPAMLVSTFRGRETTFALSLLVPESYRMRNRVTWDTPTYQLTTVQDSSIQDLWFGVSAGRRMDRWSLGATVFAMYHSAATVSTFEATQMSTQSYASQIARISIGTVGLSAVLGAQYQVTPIFTVGARLHTPVLEVHGEGDLYQSNQAAQNGVLQPTAVVDEPDATASYALPLDVGVGVRFTPTPRIDLFADVNLQAGTTFDAFSSPSATRSLDSDAAPRASVGAEVTPLDWLAFRAGALWNPSAYPDLDAGASGSRRTDFYGFTGGVSFTRDRVSSGIGGFYLGSTGEIIPQFEGVDPEPYSIRMYGVLLTTSYRL